MGHLFFVKGYREGVWEWVGIWTIDFGYWPSDDEQRRRDAERMAVVQLGGRKRTLLLCRQGLDCRALCLYKFFASSI